MSEKSKPKQYGFFIFVIFLGVLKVWAVFSFTSALTTAFACAILFFLFLKGVRINQKLDKKIEVHDAKNRAVIDHNETLIGLEIARKEEIKKQRLEKLGLRDL